eukprot:CAMPEP_0114305460 /NCGR_PEP_ID=MMETSP0059-20121206/16354_1 /TAXON_ID=36894 /ORGANISM="Pyramimonas parkeae, Strain CCMP726" /LENGTH=156 /DNA_ID=CAMNT_0001428671 /DNA_START=441 /DNA_END=911 /DNA_ORIENTATION=+
MAAIHYTKQLTTLRQLQHQFPVYEVVTQLTGGLEVRRVERFVITVLLVAVVVTNPAAVPREMQKEAVSVARVRRQPLQRLHHRRARRGGVRAVVHEHAHVVRVAGEAAAAQQLLHVLDVVVAPAQRHRGACVVDAHQQRARAAAAFGLNKLYTCVG